MNALATLLLLLASAGVAAGPVASIELRPQAQLAGAVVTLGDVARISSPDLALVRTLVDLPLGPAPAPGQAVSLQRAAVADWLRARTGLAGAALQWSGPPASEVAGASRLLRGEDIAAAAESALREWLAGQVGRAEVQLHGLPHDVDTPAGAVRLQARSLAHLALRARMLVWVEVWSGPRFVRAVPVAFQVHAWRELPVAATRLEPGAPLSIASLEPQEVDIAAQPAAQQILEPMGLRARRLLRAGEPLHAGNTEAEPAVQRGQWATLRSGVGAITTEARVEVLQDGRLGERVRVRVRQAGAAAGVIARVAGPGQLELAR